MHKSLLVKQTFHVLQHVHIVLTSGIFCQDWVCSTHFTLIFIFISIFPETVTRRCSRYSRCAGSLQLCKKKKLHHLYFPINCANFLRTPSSWNTCWSCFYRSNILQPNARRDVLTGYGKVHNEGKQLENV